jgi:hypothetical protein
VKAPPTCRCDRRIEFEYGLCEKCGKPIDARRPLASTVALGGAMIEVATGKRRLSPRTKGIKT